MLVDVVPTPFTCEVLPDRERVVVSLTGELDMATCPAVWKTLEELISAGFAKVIVDLSGLAFLDSSGLHLLVASNNLAAEHGCALSLVPGPSAVRRIFELAGLEGTFSFESIARESRCCHRHPG